MRPGKAQQAWPQPSFLGNLGHQSSAFVALFVLRPGFLGNLGQKKLGLPGLQDLSQDWPGFCGIPGLKGITLQQNLLASLVILSHEGHSLFYANANFLQKRSPRFKPGLARLFQISRPKKVCVHV